MTFKQAFRFGKRVYKSWSDDRAGSLAAALAYFTIFSLAPLLIVLIGVVGLAFGQNAAREQILAEISKAIGSRGAEFINGAISSAGGRNKNIWATIIGGATLLLGSLGVFSQLQQSLDLIFQSPKSKTKGWVKAIRDKLLSFGMVLTVGFLLIVSLAVSAGLHALGSRLFGSSNLLWLTQAGDIALSFIIIGILFAIMYKFLPSAHLTWRHSLVGGLVTAALFTLGKYLIGIYLGSSAVASAYGAAASLVLILLWIYYSAQIFYLGAEFTQVYRTRHSHH